MLAHGTAQAAAYNVTIGLAGLSGAGLAARLLGHEDDAARWTTRRDELEAAVLARELRQPAPGKPSCRHAS